ncbi:UNVERIFIED_CONTAM: hypothetical protein GTU68_000435, partial [Idotea baltica]|nr:hypothetical protein [Idotea baltica]
QNILTDCTLACDGQKFSVHRLVLVTCSDFFRSLLGDVPCQHPIIFLRGINGREMQALIDFMYMGKIDVPQKEVPELLSTAEILQIKGLGVLNSDNKSTSDKKESCKRKRSPLCNSKSFETCQTEKNSSPLLKYDACETSSSDKDYPSKISRRDWMGHSVNNEEFAQTSGSHPSAKDRPLR